MNLKPQPRPVRGRARRPSARGARARRFGLSSRGARRPGTPLRRRVAARLPSLGRSLAVLGAIASSGALVAALSGPWLQVTGVAFAGHHHTDADDLERLLGSVRGRSVLTVDTRALAEAAKALPAVGDVTLRVTVVPGTVEADVVEHDVAFVWQTASARYLGAADGTIFASVRNDEALPSELAALPQIRDDRFAARLVSVGDVLPEPIVRTALRLVAIDPAVLGSSATHVQVRVDDEYGFRLVSSAPAWEVALGAYGTDPTETEAEASERLERQVAAVRTLFAARAESEIGWVDVRNPGKVYFRAKG